MDVSGLLQAPTEERAPGTHCIGVWVGTEPVCTRWRTE